MLGQIVFGSPFQDGRHLIVAHLIRHKTLQSCFHVFVETLQQSQSEGVLHREILVFVIHANTPVIALIVCVVECVSIIVLGRHCGIVGALVVVQIQGVDNTRYGHIFLLHGGVYRVLFGFLCHQTVHGFLRFHLDARAVRRCILLSSRFITHDLGIFRSSFGPFLHRLILPSAQVVFPHALCLLLGLALFLVLGSSLCKLARFDFLIGHLHFPVETNIVSMREEQML